VTGSGVFAAARLLQQVTKACRWLQLYCRLDYLLCMAATRAMAMLAVVTAAVVVVMAV
jgi:hypothetical protein